MNWESRSALFLRKSAEVLLTAALWTACFGVSWAGQSVSLGWKPSPDTNAVGYAVYYGTSSGAYSSRIDAGTKTTCTVPDLAEGVEYHFVAMAYDANGLESPPSNEVSFTVPTNTPPVLTISAPNVTKVFSSNLEAFIPIYTGFVDGDTPETLSSRPVLTTTASSLSPVGTYPIRPSGAESSKYTIQYLDGTLTIVPAVTTVVVSSSQNPCVPGQAVTLTTTLSVAAPGQGTPTGTVQFRIDGASVGQPVPLNSGIATFTTSSLTHGAHQVLVEYAGDGNFIGTTNSLSSPQVINTPPVTGSDTIQRVGTNSINIAASDLMANDSDADGDPLTFLGASASSANGGSITPSDGWLFYTPPAGSVGTDSFTYTVSDGYGPSATGTVFLNIVADYGPSPSLTIVSLADGSFVIRGDGIPGRAYRIEYTDDADYLSQPNWQTLGTAVADDSGMFSFADTAGSRQRFYRSVYP